MSFSMTEERHWGEPAQGQGDEDKVDGIVGVFVTSFDARAGNMTEWVWPPGLPRAGLEFKSIPSGAHSLHTDHVLFSHSPTTSYGLACYHLIRLQSASDPAWPQAERGARLKSAGILSRDHTRLRWATAFLQTQARHLLAHPGSYTALKDFYERAQGRPTPEIGLEACPGMDAACVAFVAMMGPKLMALWKMALLRSRMMVLGQTVGQGCCWVDLLTGMAATGILPVGERPLRPLFYTSLAESDQIEATTFVTCVSDRILASKPQLWDVWVDTGAGIGTVVVSDQSLRSLSRATVSDRRRMVDLRATIESAADPFAAFQSFFLRLNDALFSALYAQAGATGGPLACDTVLHLGLNPKADRHFLRLLISAYGFDLEPPQLNLCCFPY